MSALMKGKKIVALALGLTLMSSVTGQAFAFACKDTGKSGSTCFEECKIRPDVPISDAISNIMCY